MVKYQDNKVLVLYTVCDTVIQGVRLNRDTTCKVVHREVIYDLQVNCMFGNMYPIQFS